MKKRLSFILIIVFIFSFSSFAQLQKVSIDHSITGICEGDSIQLFLEIVSIGEVQLSFQWTPNDNISSDKSDAPFVFPKQTTIYTVTVSDVDNGVNLSDSITITVVPKPEVIAPLDNSTCANEPYTLYPEPFNYAENPFWTHNGQGHFKGGSDNLSVTYIPAPEEQGRIMFIITGHAIDYCGDVSDTTFITYYEATTAEILTDDQTVCSNEVLSIEAVAENYTQFTWRHNGNGELQNTNTLTPIYVPHSKEFGNVDIVLDVGGLGCDKSDTLSINISQISGENVDEVVACEGERVNLNVTFSPEYTYLWNTGETTNEIVITATMSDIYTVEIQNTDGCSDTAVILLDVKENPEISLFPDPENQVLTVFPDDLAKYEFYGNNNDLLYSGKSNRYVFSEAKDIYNIVYVVAYNEFGCSSNADNNFSEFYQLPTLTKVNAFSPNNDGINDHLLPGRKTTVFDRTHKILYEGWDGWDGKYKGKKLPQGTYFYVVYDDDGKVFYKGPVTLLR